MKITRFSSATATTGDDVTLDDTLDAIRGGFHLSKIMALRSEADPAKASEIKRSLPAVTFAGAFDRRAKDGLRERSGLIVLDFDHVPDPEGLRDDLGNDPHCRAAFVSPSGTGVKAVFRIDPALDHAGAFTAAASYVRARYGIEADPSGKDINRLCFLSFDPGLRSRPEAEPIPASWATIETRAMTTPAPAKPRDPDTSLSPGDDFNERGEARLFELLREGGWSEAGGTHQWTRPGKASGISATWNGQHFFVFTSSAPPFEAHQCYRPFAVVAMLRHAGDFAEAARALAAEGYGDQTRSHRRSNPVSSSHDAMTGNLAKGQKIEDIEAFYDSERKEYLVRNPEGVWQSYCESQFRRRLKAAGFRASPRKDEKGIELEPLSEVDQALIYLQDHRPVGYSGRLCGRRPGYYHENGLRFLVTEGPRFIEPRPGGWSVLRQFLRGLLCDGENGNDGERQWAIFCGWLKCGIEALRAGEIRQAQALAIAGPANCGKSLLQKVITEALGGRAAKGAGYMSGRSDFNGDLFEAEHVMLEDEFMSHAIRDRQRLGAEIKNMTVSTGCVQCNRKHRHPVNLGAWWRVTITLNDDPEALQVLPPLDDHIADKIVLMRASRFEMPMPTTTGDELRAFWQAIIEALPGFLHWLLNDFTIPEALRDSRYGVTGWHHPAMKAALERLSPEARLLELIDLAEIGNGSEWRGTAAELDSALKRDGATAFDARSLLSWSGSTGTYLGRLAKKRPDRVEQARTSESRDWIIRPQISENV